MFIKQVNFTIPSGLPTMKSILLKSLALFLLLVLPALAQDEKPDAQPEAKPTQEGATATDENEENTAGPLSGHSYHGEAFNEGPRQRAYLIPGMANVDFPITTKSEEQKSWI